jgi:hypothetical protein
MGLRHKLARGGADPLYLLEFVWLAVSVTLRSQAGHQHRRNQTRGKKCHQCATAGPG